MKPVPPEAPGQLTEREVKFKGSPGKAISAQLRTESYEPVTLLQGCPASCGFTDYIQSSIKLYQYPKIYMSVTNSYMWLNTN